MALIGRLNKVKKDRQAVHREVEASVSVLNARDGNRYIQIDTVGSPDRARAGNVNQTIQFNQDSASQLLALIRETYPEIV
jgi:hypothetical protein